MRRSLLADLEDRGLLGWDRRANRYDLHPLVRGVTWSGVTNQARQGIYATLSAHFASLPMLDRDDWREVSSLEELTPAIELYNTLIGLARYDEAKDLFYERLGYATLYRLSAYRPRAELLELLFPDGLDQLPRLSRPDDQGYVLDTLALSMRDQPGRAAALFRRNIDIREKMGDQKNVSVGLGNLSDVLRFSGALRETENAARRALLIARQLNDQDDEALSLCSLGLVLAARGGKLDSAKALDRSLVLARRGSAHIPYDYQAMRAVWFGAYADAQRWANQAMTYAQGRPFVRVIIRAARLQSEAALGLDDVSTAEERLHYALARARTVNLMEEELPALIGLAWCDGPPFAYQRGLKAAKAHLAALGVPEPAMLPFDESRYEPMPQVEIDLPGEEEAEDQGL